MLNTGVIGMGVGEKHATAYQRHADCRLRSVCDFDTDKTLYLESKYPNVTVHDQDLGILDDESIDIVSIASYDNYHSDQIIRTIERGKHVVSEKPLCLSYDELLKIREIQKINPHVRLTSNLVLRANSRFGRLKQDIVDGQFGEVYFLEGDYYWGRRNKLFNWRAKMDFYSIILGAAIHMIDLVMWLLNEKPISVQAIGNDIANRNSELQFNSFAIILLNFESGAIAKLTGNGGCIHPHFHGLKIFGTARTAIHDLAGAYYLEESGPDSARSPIVEPYPEKETRDKVIHSFVDSILDPVATPLVPQLDVYDVMSACFAAEQAMNSGKTVTIEYLA